MTSTIWLPMVYTGFRLIMGPESDGNLIAADLAELLLGHLSIWWPLNTPCRRPDGGVSGQAHDGVRRDRLAGPDSPTMPSTSPWFMLKETPFSALTSPAGE